MARQSGRKPPQQQKVRGKGGGLLMGIMIGLIMGLTIAAGMAWYLHSQPTSFKQTEQAPAAPVLPPPTALAAAPEVMPGPEPAAAATPAPKSARPAPPTEPAPAKPAQAAKDAKTPSNYTFFDILPGDRPSKPAEARLPREVWWLQIAALKEAKDAERLKAKLALLGLDVQMQKVASGEATLHRVRVGPFKTEDDALGALDTLPANNYEPRLFKEKLDPP